LERSLNDQVGGPGTVGPSSYFIQGGKSGQSQRFLNSWQKTRHTSLRPPAGPGPKSPISIPPIMRHDSRLSPGRDSGPISGNLEIGGSEGIPDFNLKVPIHVRPESPGKQRAPVSRFGRFDFKRLQVPSYGVVCGARTIPADIRGPARDRYRGGTQP
jgi:hypothetical protein